jgi:poly(glycerol-phosphate) alpha-glucosyltransferase
VVPNGVELPEGLTTEDTESTEGKKRLLFLGRIHPKKGLVGLLKAWAEIQKPNAGIKNSKDWQLVIAGWDQGGHEGELRALCSELGLKTASRFSHEGTGSTEGLNLKIKALTPDAERADVVLCGPAFGKEKEELLRSASAFILPSLSEGLPMSVLEAWAYELPVVMTPECNLPEGFASQAALEIRNSQMGNANWEGLRTLLDMSDSDRIEMGRRGRRLVEEKFTWPKVAAQIKSLYEEILGR